jgi:hypothetical protein
VPNPWIVSATVDCPFGARTLEGVWFRGRRFALPPSTMVEPFGLKVGKSAIQNGVSQVSLRRAHSSEFVRNRGIEMVTNSHHLKPIAPQHLTTARPCFTSRRRGHANREWSMIGYCVTGHTQSPLEIGL